MMNRVISYEAGIVELALTTEHSVYSNYGEAAVANQVFETGRKHLDQLDGYPTEANITHSIKLETALRSLKIALEQRYNTVEEFTDQAAAELLIETKRTGF